MYNYSCRPGGRFPPVNSPVGQYRIYGPNNLRNPRREALMTAPPLKTDPQFGYFPWWPEDGDEWIHPEDVGLARSMIPSDRVFCRDGEAGPFVVLHYGEVRLRVRRSLWQRLDSPKFAIGDWVEVLTRGQTNALRIGVIRELLWDEHAKEIRYQISEAGQSIEQRYSDADLQRTGPTRG